MGKETELLEAARAGNLALADRILSQRAKLSGPLASLRRGPGANVQDSSGYTPLHHAALNGHKDIVQLLLSYDASPNILDTKGSSPLHLAAWAGHIGIVKLLLTHGPALTNVNLTTRDNESALHCAAQYGHSAVVAMLLQHGADPTVRSVRDETALDLASQYGRLETVELLVRTHPELLEPYRNPRGVFSHTPLHRASKNGHKAVVVVLLKAGHSVNACTAAGAALHEAALCGKLNVARALLARGADPRVRDRAGDTVLDALARFPPHVTHDIVNLINQYRMSNGYDSDQEDLPRIPVQQHDGLNSPYDNVLPSNVRDNRHIWERRGEDERRVSGTSAISMNTQSSSSPHIKTKNATKPHPSVFMLSFASKCFGIKPKTKSITSSDTLPYRRKSDSSAQKVTNESNNGSTLRVGKSSFFNRKKSSSEVELPKKVKESKKSSKKKKKKTLIPHSTSLPDILEMSETISEKSDSFNSIVSISNSLYGESREVIDDSLPCDEIEYNVPKNNNSVDSYNSLPGDLPIYENTVTPSIIRHKSEIIPRTIPKTNIPKSKSHNYKNPKPTLRISHSIRTLKNWTAENTSFKNSEPVYEPEVFPRPIQNNFTEGVSNNLYYAHIDFNRTQVVPDSDYELFDFKSHTIVSQPNEVADAQNSNVFKPIEVFRGSSTVFIDADSLIDDPTNTPIQEERKDSSRNRASVDSQSKNSYGARSSRGSSTTLSSVTSYSEFVDAVNVDMGSRSTSWQLEPLPSDSTTSAAGNSLRSIHLTERYSLESDFSNNSSYTNRSSVQSSGSGYLPMGGVLCFSNGMRSADQSGGITTLRQIRDRRDPVYQNMVLTKEITGREIMSPISENPPVKKSVYHIRGTGDCIFEKPSENEYIYIFNRSSLQNTEVNPFFRIPRKPLDSDPRNVCFCGGRIENEKVITAAESDQTKDTNLSEKNNFTCYCQDDSCRFHYTKAFKFLNVHYSPLTHSVSFPDLHFLFDTTNDSAAPYDFKSFSENCTIDRKYSSSAFVLCNPGSVCESSSSSLSFHSVSEDQTYIEMGAKPAPRHENYEMISNFATLGAGSHHPNNSSMCRSLLEGGWLCVRSGSDGGHYPYSKSSVMDGSYYSEELSSSYQSGKHREPDQLSISSTTSSTGGPSPRERQRCGTNESSISGQGMYMSMGASSGYHAHSPGSNNKVSPTPPKKPPRRNLSVSPTHLLPPGGIPDVTSDRSHHLVRTGQTRSQDDLDDLGPTKHSGLRHGRSVDQYVDNKVSPRTKPVPQPRPSLALLASRREQPVAISTMYENVVIKEVNPRRKLRRNNQYENYQPREAALDEDSSYSRSKNQKYHSSQERSSQESLLDDVSSSCQGGSTDSMGYRNDRSAQQTPLSPTHYNQPPTPDHPPPSAKQAEMSIHERIRPLSQEYKRMSRDMETETDPRFLARSSSPASSASTDHCVEEYVAEVPFAGLFKGSTTTLDGIGVRPVPAERPKSLRKLKAVYDNGNIIRPKEILPGTRIDPDVDPWQYRHDEKETSNPPSVTSSDKPLSLLSPFDEQEEWAKINEIMASFGSRIVRESVFAEELEQEFKSRLGARFSCSESSLSPSVPVVPSILSWLTGLGLQHLESNFVNNGYDDLDFINGVIEDNDLAEMAIEEPEKTKVLESSKTLPTKIDEVMSVAPSNHNNNNGDKEPEQDPEAVNKWLTSIGLECYQDTFRRHLYTDMERVRRIWEVELTAVLEIQKVGHRRRILASVAGRQNGPINNIEDIKADLNTLERNIQTLKAEIKEKLPDTTPVKTNHIPNHADPPKTTNLTSTPGGETLKRSHKKNRPPPPPPARPDLEIRAPSALMVGVPGTTCAQWKHQPLVLVTGSVMYVANYLGSTIVKELRGKESTQKSIQKLKKSTNEPRALPDIILSISYRGVKFLNTITRDLVCEHEIRNIHLACQDADDLTHFAYITKDVTKTHYCHVFCVATMDQATEVILTLGQAFEVAYQMALRESAMKNNNTLPSQVRSQSSNQISQQAKTPTHEKTNNNLPKDRTNPVHGRSHSVTEIKLNGHQLKVAPITVSLSNEDFQTVNRNGDVQKSPRTPSAKAPIALAEEL